MALVMVAEAASQPPKVTISVMNKGNREELQGGVKRQTMMQVEALLNSCWFDSTTTEFYRFDDPVGLWSKAREEDHIAIDYEKPIEVTGSGVPLPVSEITLRLADVDVLLTRHDDRVVGYRDCEARNYVELLCADSFRGKSPGYNDETCQMFESNIEEFFPLRVEGQLISHVFAKWTPGTEEATGDLAASDMQLLRDCGIGGRVDSYAWGKNYYGRPPTKVIVLLKEPVTDRLRLKIPKNTVGIYMQQNGQSLTACDGDMPTVDQFINLSPDHRDPLTTLFFIESPDGSSQGGTAASWKESEWQKRNE
jgi:hypothetical protein